MPAADHLPATIRSATDADLDGVVEVLWAVAAEGCWIGTEVPFDRQGRRRAMADLLAKGNGAIFVAVAAHPGYEPEVIGNLSVVVAPYGVADVGMALLNGWRGQGLGTALLDAGMAWAQASGAHKAALEVWPHNAAALALYRRAGFVEEGRKRRHYRRANGEIWDAILMGHPLP